MRGWVIRIKVCSDWLFAKTRSLIGCMIGHWRWGRGFWTCVDIIFVRPVLDRPSLSCPTLRRLGLRYRIGTTWAYTTCVNTTTTGVYSQRIRTGCVYTKRRSFRINRTFTIHRSFRPRTKGRCRCPGCNLLSSRMKHFKNISGDYWQISEKSAKRFFTPSFFSAIL